MRWFSNYRSSHWSPKRRWKWKVIIFSATYAAVMQSLVAEPRYSRGLQNLCHAYVCSERMEQIPMVQSVVCEEISINAVLWIIKFLSQTLTLCDSKHLSATNCMHFLNIHYVTTIINRNKVHVVNWKWICVHFEFDEMPECQSNYVDDYWNSLPCNAVKVKRLARVKQERMRLNENRK